MAKGSRGDFTDILVAKKVLEPRPARRSAQPAAADRRQAPGRPRQARLRQHRRGHGRHRRVPRPAVRRPDRGHHSRRRHRAGARVGGPRKRRPAACRRKTARSRSSSAIPTDFDTHPEAPVHPEQGHPAGPRRPRADHRGHQPALRPDRNRIGRLDAAEFTDTAIDFTETERDRGRPAAATRAMPPSSSSST